MSERPPSIEELTGMLTRAERRYREDLRDNTAALFGEMFKEADAKAVGTAFGAGDSETRLDRLRSEQDAIRANDLEMRRMLGQELTPEEERERASLAARRSESGYYRPGEDA